MRLEHAFTVLAPIDTVWYALLDPQRVAPCFPGATITSSSGDVFAGIVKVRLGPISLEYRGTGLFTDTDEAAHRAVIEATGTAAGGQGTAAAKIEATLAENGEGTTVNVVTDLRITGKLAQFGQRLIEDVSMKILGQFADCLNKQLGVPRGAQARRPVAAAQFVDRQLDQEPVPLSASKEPLAVAAGVKGSGDRRSVFLVHGRDASAAAAMRKLLRALGLRIIEWEDALEHLGQGPSPYVGDIVMAGMRLADAVIVLFTPDDLVHLRPDLAGDGEVETTIQGQARPNVIYEAGIADALNRARTLLVEVGRVKGLSDLGGRNTLRFNGSIESRRQLASRLRSANLNVDDIGLSWLSAGDFDASLNAARVALTLVTGIKTATDQHGRDRGQSAPAG